MIALELVPGTAAADLVLAAGVAVAVVARASVAVTEIRLRVPGWPVLRCGAAAVGLVVHDVAVGVLAVLALGAGARWIAQLAALDDLAVTGVVAASVVLGLVAAPVVLRRRRGIGVRAMVRPRHRVVEPCLPLRARLLDVVQRSGTRAVSRWIGVRVDRCLRRCGATPEHLLPAAWPGARLRLREVPGLPRTELALLLLQAQAIMDDASPASERLLTVLHLVHSRTGRRGVLGVLEEARRSPVRHGRSGAAAWGSSPQAVPAPVPSAAARVPGPASPVPEVPVPEVLGVPVPGVPVSGVPVSGVPVSGVPVSGVPVSGVPVQPVSAEKTTYVPTDVSVLAEEPIPAASSR